MKLSLALLFSLAASVSAAPHTRDVAPDVVVPEVVAPEVAAKGALEIAAEEATCGKNAYTASQVSAASDAACTHVKENSKAGSSSYPHRYNNYEGFDFKGLDGPFQEFPIKKSGVYTGGSPGADRIVITEDCKFAGAITHTGASGNKFVACKGTS